MLPWCGADGVGSYCERHRLALEIPNYCPICIGETDEGRAASKADADAWNRIFAAESEAKHDGREWNWAWVTRDMWLW